MYAVTKLAPELNALELRVATVFPRNVTVTRLGVVKASLPMVLTLLPMVTLVRAEQPLKAYVLIVVTLLGMITLGRLVQP